MKKTMALDVITHHLQGQFKNPTKSQNPYLLAQHRHFATPTIVSPSLSVVLTQTAKKNGAARNPE
jgi:hypothetical protein